MSSSSGGNHFRGAEHVSDEPYDDNQLLPPLFEDSNASRITRSPNQDNSSPASPPSPASFSIQGGDPNSDGGYTGILNSGETGTGGNHKIEVGEGSLTLDTFGDIGTDRVTGSAQGIAPELVVSTATPEATTPVRSRPPSFSNGSTTSNNKTEPPSKPDQSFPGGDHPPTPGRSSNPTRQGTRPAFDPSSGISALAALNTIVGLGAPGTTVQLGGLSSPQQQGGSLGPGSRRGSVSSQYLPSIQPSAPTPSGATPGGNTPATGLTIPGGATSPAVATQVNSNGQILNVSSSTDISTNPNQTGTSTPSSNAPLSPPSASSSRRPSFSCPTTNEHVGPSQFALAAASAARNQKGRSSSIAGGIGGALALSGVALASPAPQLSQPLGFIGRKSSMGNLNNGGTMGSGGAGGKDGRPDTPGAPPANGEATFGGDVTTSPGRSGHLRRSSSFSQDTTTSDDSGAGGFDNPMLHYDALGGFDEVVSSLGTGYAVASKKRNDDFHTLFRNVPEDDYLIEDYGCALQREILIQGRLYISEHHLCFYANIFGWITTLIIPFSEVVTIEKRMTALIIPNAVMVATLHARHVFASFLSRDSTYDLIVNIFRITHPTVPASAALPDAVSIASEEETILSDDDKAGSRRKGSKKNRNRGKSKGTDDKPDMGMGAGVGVVEIDKPGGQLVNGGVTPDDQPAQINDVAKAGGGGAKPAKAAKAPLHPPTVCSCSKDGLHLANVCMDTVFPSTPEKIYNLMFTSGFLKTFWAENQRLTDIQIGDWAPAKSGTPLMTREYSYIKPLSAPVGPKSTKCRLSDENAHVDFDDYVVNLTTTRTPDVPGGGVFSVKTRSCFTWAKGGQCRVLVTTGVEWTGRSIINSSAIDGQKTYHADLEKAMRAYINQHRSEFQDGPGEAEGEGEEAGAEPDSVPDQPSSTTKDSSQSVDERRSKKETSTDHSPQPAESEKGELQKKLDPIMPYLQPVIDLGTDALGILVDVIGGMSTTALVLTVVISILLISNLWTLTSLRQGVGSGPPPLPLPPAPASFIRSTPFRPQRSPDDIAQAVSGALHDFFEAHSGGTAAYERASVLREKFDKKLGSAAGAGNVKAEVKQLLELLDTIEKRVGSLRQKLTSLN